MPMQTAEALRDLRQQEQPPGLDKERITGQGLSAEAYQAALRASAITNSGPAKPPAAALPAATQQLSQDQRSDVYFTADAHIKQIQAAAGNPATPEAGQRILAAAGTALSDQSYKAWQQTEKAKGIVDSTSVLAVAAYARLADPSFTDHFDRSKNFIQSPEQQKELLGQVSTMLGQRLAQIDADIEKKKLNTFFNDTTELEKKKGFLTGMQNCLDGIKLSLEQDKTRRPGMYPQEEASILLMCGILQGSDNLSQVVKAVTKVTGKPLSFTAEGPQLFPVAQPEDRAVRINNWENSDPVVSKKDKDVGFLGRMFGAEKLLK